MSGFYNRAADILCKIMSKKSSIKNLIFTSDVHDKKRLYGLILETLKYRQTLRLVIDQAQLSPGDFIKIVSGKKELGQYLVLLLAYELILGNGISGQGTYKEVMSKYKTRLRAEWVKLKVKRGAKCNEEMIPAHLRIEGI